MFGDMATPHRLLTVVLAVLVLVAGGCVSSSDQASPPAVIVDTDMGIDDVRALLFLLEHDEVDVVAVSVTGSGLARCPEAGWNARAILDAYGQADTPVGCGDRAPLSGFNTAPSAWRDQATALAGMALEAGKQELPPATEILVDALADNPGATVLALGPLTNLAPVLDNEDTAANVGELRIMGGAVDVGGNIFSFTNFTAEFNIWIDPTAAQQILDSGVPISVIPLDATNEVPVTPATVAALATGKTRAAELINGFYSANPLIGGVYHWDDLAAVTLVDETIVDMQTLSLSVVTDPDSGELGRTVADDGGTEVRVAMSADRDRFENTFFATVAGRPQSTADAWTPTATVNFDGDECRYDGPDPPTASLEVEITNSSTTPGLGVLVVVYDPGTTLEQAEAFARSGIDGPPPYFDIVSVAPLPTSTTSVWLMSDLPTDATILCVISQTDSRELAGQQLPT